MRIRLNCDSCALAAGISEMYLFTLLLLNPQFQPLKAARTRWHAMAMCSHLTPCSLTAAAQRCHYYLR